MNRHIEKLQSEVQTVREELLSHKLYSQIKTVEDLAVFMEFHVFAVWDFMSLLKSLQRNLTCVELPWLPVGNPETRYLINEIVLGEESDVDENGKILSHFELYLKAMKQIGCDTKTIDALIKNLNKRIPLTESMTIAAVPEAPTAFVNHTFSVINSNAPHLQAAVFTFGREDLIPEMFIRLVTTLNKQNGDSISLLKYYLERHIEVDGDHHSRLAHRMMNELCGEDEKKWGEATVAVKNTLSQRVQLWDAIAEQIEAKQLLSTSIA
jgi:pyrroloquinoline quinone (PQQ) biosynthesis protein C